MTATPMPTLTSANVFEASTGRVLHAVLGTALPITSGVASASTALNAAFKELGYLDDSGLTETPTRTVTKTKGWQNGDIIRVKQTEHSDVFEFAMAELSDETIKVYTGGGTASAFTINGSALPIESYVIEIIDGAVIRRIVIPRGQVTETKPLQWAGDVPVVFGVTIEAFPDASGNKSYNASGAVTLS